MQLNIIFNRIHIITLEFIDSIYFELNKFNLKSLISTTDVETLDIVISKEEGKKTSKT